MTTVSSDKYRLEPVFSAEEIALRVKDLAAQISRHYLHQEVMVLGILKGAFIFVADLVRELEIPLMVHFLQTSSYQGTKSTGKISIYQTSHIDVAGKHVLIVEDIVDTGRTFSKLLKHLAEQNPQSIKTCALLNKPSCREVEVDVDFVGFEIPNIFVVGYGLDVDERFRELPYIAKVLSI